MPRPRPFAPVLAYFLGGAGHFALGRWLRGLTWNFVDSLVLAGAVGAARLMSPRVFWLCVAGSVLIRLAAVIDVVRLRRTVTEVPSAGKVALACVALLVVATLEALSVRATQLEAFKIPAGSMIPTLQVGDHIFVDKTGWKPARGEVVVFPYPKEPDKDFVKRVLAIGGDTIRFDDDVPVINGQPVARKPLGACTYQDYEETSRRWETRRCEGFEETLDGHSYQVIFDGNGTPRSNREVRVPEGQIFVAGDNRDNSFDSRFWGFVPADSVKGRALYVWWSQGPDGSRSERSGLPVR